MKNISGATVALLAVLTFLGAGCGDAKEGIAKQEADSVASVVASVDSAMQAPPPPLAQAPASLSADTVPLRAPDGAPARYGVASGEILQRFTGSSIGERRIIFDRYGLRERREENMAPNPPGAKGAVNNIITIATPEENSYADVRTQRGWKRTNEGVSRYLASPESKTMSLADYVVHMSGAERLPDTTIAGYHCTVLRKKVKGMTVTNWIWRGIVIRERLYSHADNLEYFVEPVSIRADITVADTTFTFPAGYQIDNFVPPAADGTKEQQK